MAVEWLRSSYSSEWKLFRGLARRSKGRYYFVGDDVPFYSGTHNLHSRRWYDANWKHEIDLGEVTDVAHGKDKGIPPAKTPLLRSIGSADCIANGELPNDFVWSQDLIDGFPIRCLTDDAWARVASFERCPTRRAWASIIVQLYAFDDVSIRATIADWLGDVLTPTEYVVTIHHHEGVFPGMVIIKAEGFCAFALDGTSNFQEFALQAFALAQAPSDYGILSTTPLWNAAGSYVLAKLQLAGMVPDEKVFACGHSYGGAAALNIAARIRANQVNTTIRFLTFGCPKIGDAKFVTLVQKCEGYNLANDNDAIPILPPTIAELRLILPFLVWPLMNNWPLWERPPEQVFVADDGSLFQRVPLLLDQITLLAIATQAFEQKRIAPFQGHRMEEYLLRCQRLCPEPNWPIEKPTSQIIWRPEAVLAMESKLRFSRKGMLVLQSPDPIPDGKSCDQSKPMILDAENTLHLESGYAGYYWYRFAADPSVDYRLHIVSSTTFTRLTYLRGDSCASLTEIASAPVFYGDGDTFLGHHAGAYLFLRFDEYVYGENDLVFKLELW